MPHLYSNLALTTHLLRAKLIVFSWLKCMTFTLSPPVSISVLVSLFYSVSFHSRLPASLLTYSYLSIEQGCACIVTSDLLFSLPLFSHTMTQYVANLITSRLCSAVLHNVSYCTLLHIQGTSIPIPTLFLSLTSV